jgi:hypothetical protein
LHRQLTADAPAFNLLKSHFRPQANRKPAAPRKELQRDEIILDSVEESSLRRPTALWAQGRSGGRNFIVQVGQDSLNGRRIFNAAVRRVDNDPDQSGAVLIVCNPSPISHRAI